VTHNPQNVASIISTALAGARARIAWVSEGQVGGEELNLLLDLERDLEAWDHQWGATLSKFRVDLGEGQL